MSKQFIYFAGVLFLLAAILAVSAQENTAALNNASMNNTTILNNTTLNASAIEGPILPMETADDTASVETASAENETASEIIPVQNATVPVQNETSHVEEIATQNEIVPAQNITVPENVTAAAEPVSTASPLPVVLQPAVMPIGSAQRAVFAIGGGQTSPHLFSIDGKALPQGAYEVGLPAKTIMDLSALPFFVNKI